MGLGLGFDEMALKKPSLDELLSNPRVGPPLTGPSRRAAWLCHSEGSPAGLM